ncbi:MAG: YesL family protein [Pseudobutyrivibrio sp.]|nr:YesL family protein [Pseudobutyrivibrio sp.]
MDFLRPDSEFMESVGRVADYIIINLLCLLCSIPIVTIGAAFTAKFYVSMKMVKGEEPSVAKAYFKSFKENFKQATVMWLIALAVILILVFDWYQVIYGMASTMPFVLKVALAVISFIVWSVIYCMFPFLARYDVTNKELFKASMVMALLNLPRMALIFIVTFLPYIIGAWYIEWGLAIWLFATTVSLYYISKEFNKQLEMIIKSEEGEEVDESRDIEES